MQGKAGGGAPVAVAVPMAQHGYGQQAYGQAAVPVAQPMQRQTVVVPGAYLGPDTDVMIRHGFVRKVFGILLTQLLVTFGMIFYLNNSMESECVRPGEGPSSTCKSMYYGSWAVGIGCMIAIFCCKENAKIVPRNYILLAVCTVSEGLMLGVISSFYNTSSVFIAAGLTLVVAFALILFSMQTKHDFTGMGPYLLVALLCLFMLGFVMIFVSDDARGPMSKVYAVAGCLIFSMFIVYDTQLIVGVNKFGDPHRHRFTVDEYIWAALNLYIDIVQRA